MSSPPPPASAPSFLGPPDPGSIDLGSTLLGLRQSRGLGTGTLARLAGTSKRSILDWESGRYVPAGPALDRLLAALEVAESERALLLARHAPGYAGVALAHTAAGAPVHVGQIFRAMRLRRAWTQSDLAGRVGVTQGALAKWESGDSRPNDDSRERLLRALEVSPEERAALTSVGAAEAGASDAIEPGGYKERILEAGHRVPFALRDVALLGIESELWWEAARRPNLRSLLGETIALRAQTALLRGAVGEVDAIATRAIRIAREAGAEDAGAFDAVVGAVHAACWNLQRTPGGAPRAARVLERWTGRVRHETCRTWLHAAAGLAWVRAGDERGLSRLRDLDERARGDDPERVRYHRIDLVEGLLLARRPEQALDLVGPLENATAAATIAKAHLASGRVPPAATISGLRSGPERHPLAEREASEVEREFVRSGGDPLLLAG